MSNDEIAPAAGPGNNEPTPRRKKTLMVLLCLVVIAAGGIGAITMIQTAPQAHKRPPEKMAPLVGVQKVYPQTRQVEIQAMGSVVPARELTLKSRVAGEILRMHPEFTPGGIIERGQLLLEIDDIDYRLIIAQKQSAVADASYALKLELGRQDVAQREWELLNGDSSAFEADAELALRKPHLEKARADLIAAEAELEAARLQLERTKIYAPFNAIIRSTLVERGSHVAAQETLATLAGADTYWVQASVPVDRLNWIDISDGRQQPGAQVQITYNGGAVRKGRVIKLLSDLATEGRMARLIIAVDDPLNLKAGQTEKPAMLIGEYVRVKILGDHIAEAFRIPRAALRDNTRIWIAGPNDRLEIREVGTIWRDTQYVLLTQGLQPGDRVIITDLAAPIPDMAITIEDSDPSTIRPASNENPRPEEAKKN